ncbi:MAG TPA: presqualene diphosphate synthase HpnD [Gammaproteobacteria bacterium]|nr:presqualene diphosphate synthase HpnD [Gammaproteobacteria bacterium]
MNNSEEYCREKTAQSGSSFYYSFLFLPTEQKKAIMAVYAFCREVDDIVDECTDKEIAQKKLAWWHTEIDRVFTSQPEHPVGKAIAQIKDRFSLKKHLFEEILQGMNMDLSYQGYQTFEDLRLYCHCVASAPGLLAAEIFGYINPSTLEYAKNLGLAFQLVNIIRDVGEDANRGRIYLPEDELAQFSLTPQDILAKKYTQNFQNLMAYQATRARSYYEKALLALPEADKHHQRCGMIMAAIYFALLKEIEKLHFKVLNQRVCLTPLRKLWIAWKTQRTLKLSKKNMHV